MTVKDLRILVKEVLKETKTLGEIRISQPTKKPYDQVIDISLEYTGCSEYGVLIDGMKNNENISVHICLDVEEYWEPAEPQTLYSPGTAGGLTELELDIINGTIYNETNTLDRTLTSGEIVAIKRDKAVMDHIYQLLFDEISNRPQDEPYDPYDY